MVLLGNSLYWNLPPKNFQILAGVSFLNMKFPASKHIHLIKQNIVKRTKNLNTDTTKLLNQKSNKQQAKK